MDTPAFSHPDVVAAVDDLAAAGWTVYRTELMGGRVCLSAAPRLGGKLITGVGQTDVGAMTHLVERFAELRRSQAPTAG